MIAIIHSGTLYTVNLNGAYTELSSGWGETQTMVEDQGTVFIVCAGILYKVSLSDGTYKELSSGWAGTTAITKHNNDLFILDSGTLYKVDKEKGSYTELSGGWSGSRLMS